MSRSDPEALQLAVRVFPSPKIKYQKQLSQRAWELPNAMFVFDTETRTDASQRLTFGSYRFIVDGECREEGIFYGDDLPKKDIRTISNYVANHSAETVHGGNIELLTRDDFVNKLYKAAYKGQCLVVAFNFPFDASRVAFNWAVARGRFAGGFALELWSYIDKEGRMHHDPYRPRLCIKHIDSKRALKGFTSRRNPDREDLIPPDSETGEPESGFKFRGHILDLRTLAFALTDRGHTLDSACKAFGVEHGKQHVAKHGEVTPEYIDYNRRDVLATSELAFKLLEEYQALRRNVNG